MCKKISSRTFVILRTWIRKEVAFYSWMQTKRRIGQSRRADDDQIQRRRTTSFPSHESIVPWNAQKQRRWKIIFSLLCRWGYGWNCFFAQIFLFFRSVSVEQSQICVMNTVFVKQETERPVLAGQSDPFFQPARMLITTPTFSVEVFAQENLLQKYKERVERLTQQDWLIKICMDAGFLTNSWSRTVCHDKRHWRVLTIYRTSDMSWVHFATGRTINWPERLDSRGTPKLDPY